MFHWLWLCYIGVFVTVFCILCPLFSFSFFLSCLVAIILMNKDSIRMSTVYFFISQNRKRIEWTVPQEVVQPETFANAPHTHTHTHTHTSNLTCPVHSNSRSLLLKFALSMTKKKKKMTMIMMMMMMMIMSSSHSRALKSLSFSGCYWIVHNYGQAYSRLGRPTRNCSQTFLDKAQMKSITNCSGKCLPRERNIRL